MKMLLLENSRLTVLPTIALYYLWRNGTLERHLHVVLYNEASVADNQRVAYKP